MIIDSPWDSEFFGYKVGVVNAKEGNLDFVAFKKEAATYKLVYVMSDVLLEEQGLSLVDQKVIYSKLVKSQFSFVSGIDTFKEADFNGKAQMDLLDLCFQSGVYSRFLTDINFKNGEFEKLYSRWLEESVNGNIAFKVLVKRIEEEIVGFITVKKSNHNTAQIGLLAVSESHRRKGIAKELVQEAEKIAGELKMQYLTVATQKINPHAVKFYEGYGFKEQSVTNIYHYWSA